MSDDSLRAVERTLAENPDARTRFRFASELDRRGACGAALAALLAAAKPPRLSACDTNGRRLWRLEFAPRQGLAAQAGAPTARRLLAGLEEPLPEPRRELSVCFEDQRSRASAPVSAP